MNVITLFNYELHFVREALGQLKDYLLSDEVFWQLNLRSLHGASPYPQMTLGNLLLSQARLEGLKQGAGLSREDQQELKELNADIASIKKEWRSAWEKKAEREFRSRLTQWERFLDEMGDSPDQHSSNYATEVRVRAILSLLEADLPPSAAAFKSQVALQDQRLERMVTNADFVWDAEVQRAFPKTDFWYLWVKPKSQ